jgi:myo-inositol 2-dehydrogenase / D-chiro-inositol 1-dehydrogenase
MIMDKKVGVGLIGAGFIGSIHADSFKKIKNADILAVMSPPPGEAKKFAEKHQIPKHFTKLDELLALEEIDMVIIGVPNHLHCEICVKAAEAGKHVVAEKPLQKGRGEADVCRRTLFHPQVRTPEGTAG